MRTDRKVKQLIASMLVLSMLSINMPLFAQQTDQTANNTNNEQTQVADKNNADVVESNILEGEAVIDVIPENSELFTGEKIEVTKGTKLELTVASVLSSDVSMEGDEFFAEVSSDLNIDGDVVIPMGTVAHGKVTASKNQRRLGRDGFVKLEFDYLLTPDGREIPIQAKLSTKSHPIKSFAKVALTDVGYTLVGGAIGGFMALKLGGLGLAVASHGYSIAGGAAIGGTVGLTKSLIRKGKPLLIAPGDQIKIKMTSDIELPVMRQTALAEEELELEGLMVDIFDCKFEKDPFGSLNTITLSLDILNQSDHAFTFFDVALINENGGVFYPSPFGDTEMWFQKISPNSKLKGCLSFSVDNPRQKHWLVFYDKYTRGQLAKISVTNAIRKLETDKKSKKKKNKNS